MQTKGLDRSEIKVKDATDACCSSIDYTYRSKELTNSVYTNVTQMISDQLYFCNIFPEEKIS
jgi:hypothetical protein